MGRTELKLKPFVDKCLQKGYINFRKNEKNLIELVTPQYTSKLDPKYGVIFEDYERYCNRKYYGYVLSKGPLISAMRRSKFYELQKPRPKHKYEFRERSIKEIKNMSTKKRQKRVDRSPSTSGYESAESSPDIQSPVPISSPDHMPVQPDSNPVQPQAYEHVKQIPLSFLNLPKFSEEIPDVDDLDIDMEEIENIRLSDEQFEKLKEYILSDGVSINELDEYLCNTDISSDNIGECYGKSEGSGADQMDSFIDHTYCQQP